MAEFHKADIEKLIDGVLPWPATQDMLKSSKDADRFEKYVEIMQERVEFQDPILKLHTHQHDPNILHKPHHKLPTLKQNPKHTQTQNPHNHIHNNS